MSNNKYSKGNLTLLNKKDKKELKFFSNIICFSLLSEQLIALICSFIGIIVSILLNTYLCGSITSKTIENVLNSFVSSNSDPYYTFLMMLIYIAYVFLPFAFITASFKFPLSKAVPLKMHNKDLIIPLIFIGLSCSVIGTLYSDIFTLFFSKFNLEVNLDSFTPPTSVLTFIIYFVNTALVAPILEEILFRGIILQSLRKYGNFIAIFISSLLFGILHENFVQTPFAFVVGLALGIAVIETGSVITSIIMHFVINSLSVVINQVSVGASDSTIILIDIIYYSIIAVGLGLSIFYLIKKTNVFKSLSTKYFGSYAFSQHTLTTFFKTPGFIIFTSINILFMFLTLTPIK